MRLHFTLQSKLQVSQFQFSSNYSFRLASEGRLRSLIRSADFYRFNQYKMLQQGIQPGLSVSHNPASVHSQTPMLPPVSCTQKTLEARCLLLIWLFQQAPRGSVSVFPVAGKV
jgi:hypothetical protein